MDSWLPCTPNRNKGGGGRTGISGADPNCCRALGKSTSKKKLQTAVGGGVRSPPKKPVSAPGGGGGAVPPEQVPGGNSSVNFGDNQLKNPQKLEIPGGSCPPPCPPPLPQATALSSEIKT